MRIHLLQKHLHEVVHIQLGTRSVCCIEGSVRGDGISWNLLYYESRRQVLELEWDVPNVWDCHTFGVSKDRGVCHMTLDGSIDGRIYIFYLT